MKAPKTISTGADQIKQSKTNRSGQGSQTNWVNMAGGRSNLKDQCPDAVFKKAKMNPTNIC